MKRKVWVLLVDLDLPDIEGSEFDADKWNWNDLLDLHPEDKVKVSVLSTRKYDDDRTQG